MEESKQSKRTRKFLAQALMKLIIEKDFEEITVTDICDKAMITRATFYKYFEDKYHLAQCVLLELKEQVFDKGLEKFSYKKPKDLYLKLISLCFDFIEDHQKDFLLFIKHSYSDRIRIMILQTINDYIEQITEKEQHNFKFKVPVEVISKFVTGGFAYLMLFLIENNSLYSKEQILKWTDETLDALLVG